MKRKHLACLVLPLAALTSGCSVTDVRETWSRSLSAMHIGNRAGLSNEFRSAQKMFKEPEKTLLSYARMKEDNEEYSEARERYRELTIGYPDCVDAHLGLARIEMATGRAEEARKILDELARNAPDNPAVLMESGRMHAQRENWAAAMEQFEKATRIRPQDQMAHYELGLACIHSSQTDKALKHLTFAVGESAAMYNIGYLMQQQGLTAEARQWYVKALDSHPDARTAHQSRQMLSKLAHQEPGDGSQLASHSGSRSAGQGSSMPDRVNSEGHHREVVRNASRQTLDPHLGPAPRISAASSTRNHPVQEPLSAVHPAGPVGMSADGRTAGTSASVNRPVAYSESHVAWETTAPVATQAGPSVASSSSSTIVRNVPPWRGPASPPITTPQAGAAPANALQPAAVQEPPVWRSRR